MKLISGLEEGFKISMETDDIVDFSSFKKGIEILNNWIEESNDQGQYPESDIGLRCVLNRWGDKCINPEYAMLRKR